nr:sensor histidine kinase [Bacillus kexueae]
MLVATVLPFGSSILVTYFYTKESLKDRVVQENSNLLYQGKENLENYIHKLNDLSLSLYNNQNFINFLRSSEEREYYYSLDVVKNVILTILYSDDQIDRVHIAFTNDERVLSASRRTTVLFSEEIKEDNKPAYEKAKNSPYHLYIEPIQTQAINTTDVSKDVITLHRAFTNTPSEEVLAYISLEILPEKFFEISENMYNKETDEFYIFSPDGQVMYSSTSTNVTNETWVQEMLKTEEESGTIEWKDGSFNGVMMYERIAPTAGGWLLVKRVPYATLHSSAVHVAQINISFGIIGLSLVILATFFVSLKITSPIRMLLTNIQEVEKGNMNVQFKKFQEDEVGLLGMRFQQMMKKLNDLINREYKLEIENKTNQLKVLQSQINPHFLYNALQSIGTVALKHQVPQIYSLVTHLSKIMRYAMETDEDIVSLTKEMNYTKAFLLLQKERFGDQLHYTIEIEEELLDVKVPKMLLQPIIENYFKHGFDIRDGVGEIHIKVEKKDESLLLTVKDNGVGVSEERLLEIYEHFQAGNKKTDGEQTNIGLKNVYTRLTLYYGEEADLRLENHEDGGLLVTIKLPLKVDGGNESDDRG